MIKIEKKLLTDFAKAQVVNVENDGRIGKVQLQVPGADGVTVEAWVGDRLTFSAVIEGETVRLHPKKGVRYDNLEQWLRGTVGGGR